MRILVVDDEPSLRVLATRVLEKAGYQVAVCGSGEEALTQLAAAPVDVLIADKNLPGINGPEVIRLAREKLPNLAVVLITAVPDRASLSNVRIDAYLAKPFRSLATLEDGVKNALESARAHRERQELQRRLQELMANALAPAAKKSP